ncbi:MAG TPA: hypothetical protein VIZ29_03010 [Gaiellaceae bacterium]
MPSPGIEESAKITAAQATTGSQSDTTRGTACHHRADNKARR